MIWFLLLGLASVNGAVREAVIVPRVGDVTGRALSTIMLTVLIIMLSWLSIGWIQPRSSQDTWAIGAMWAALTLAFEFLAGHYLFGNPWSRLLEDYNANRSTISGPPGGLDARPAPGAFLCRRRSAPNLFRSCPGSDPA